MQTGRRRERESAAGGRSAGAKAAAGSTIVVRKEVVASGHPALCPLRAPLIIFVVREYCEDGPREGSADGCETGQDNGPL